MNIGFYGHSAASWANFPIYDQVSFIDLLVAKYNAKLVSHGVPQGSEERILFELKKTKKLNLAVIFHSMPRYIFLPTCRRDVDITDIGHRKADYIWNSKTADKTELAQAKDEYFSYGGIKETFGEIETFVDTMGLYHEFLYHPDLQMNRFYGALAQIDQYVATMKIPTIHIYDRKVIPSWFKFSSGLITPDIDDLCAELYQPGLPNNISAEGQTIVADQLSVYIDQITNDQPNT